MKKDLYQKFDVIRKKHNNIRTEERAGHKEKVEEHLTECQQVALEIGTAVEQTEETYAEEVKRLEEYCELVYTFSNEIDSSNANRHYKALEKVILQAEKEFQKFKVRAEVLFLPYKASMWDCMESVWEAFDEDENYTTTVVPIPYNEKDREGKVCKSCYEGNLFPSYVTIVDWKEYDLAVRRPDVIFIHNPYDDWNIVTEVDSAYFSSTLKKYTDMLVYIPYFVTDDEVGEDFINLPGVLFSDRVIVQNDKQKQNYEKVYNKILKEKELDKYFVPADQKFLPLGSPKFDKILMSQKEKVDITEDWKRKVEGKKVLLYNTSIQEMLNQREKYFVKLQDTLQFMKKQKDVALIWRPHPLTMATLHSMMPALEAEYMKIVQQYCSEDWGIYDESSENYRTISISDAYYGDNSSMVPLYEKTGKPSMIQNVDILSSTPYNVGGIEAFVIKEGVLWGAANTFNGLLKIDLQSCNAELMERFPGEDMNRTRLFGDAVLHENQIVFVPMSAKNIVIYDIEKLQFIQIPIDQRYSNGEKMYKEDFKFCKGVVHDHYVYLFACTFPAIVKLDMDTYEMTYIVDWRNQLNTKITDYNDVYFRSIYYDGLDQVWMASCSCNMVISYSFIDDQVKYYEVGNAEDRFSNIYCSGDKLWLSSKNNRKFIIWNYITKEMVHSTDLLLPYISTQLMKVSETIYFIPWNSSNFWTMNESDWTIQRCMIGEDRDVGYCSAMYQEHKLYMMTHDGFVVVHDFDNQTIQKHKLVSVQKIASSTAVFQDKKVLEKTDSRLKDFVNTICTKERTGDGLCIDYGKRIYESIKAEVKKTGNKYSVLR